MAISVIRPESLLRGPNCDEGIRWRHRRGRERNTIRGQRDQCALAIMIGYAESALAVGVEIVAYHLDICGQQGISGTQDSIDIKQNGGIHGGHSVILGVFRA